eukprot:CAMPEP_0172938918 /NCGR_PEP_ID=MMETSP1075-20121228/223267_1 /TAXON_ID=2916 /ORGANISM="Ceratium fusus, Strain PA161109" /LENGTH=212 /DNA_ID=CAMNT_0013800301 /DNA_START=111 /DNA_END=749 /DNA_ORIENTATION=+
MSIHAKTIGANLFVLKKAKNFYDWATSNCSPYLPITDWREVKHCFEVMDKIKRPLLTAVFCDTEKQHMKAQRWSSTLANWIDFVHIFQGRPSVEPLMPVLLQMGMDSLDSTDDKKSFCHNIVTEPCEFQQLKPTHESAQLPEDVLFQPWKVPRESSRGVSNREAHPQASPMFHQAQVDQEDEDQQWPILELVTVRRNVSFNRPWTVLGKIRA